MRRVPLIVSAVGLMVAGSVTGWFLAPAPLYESKGMIYISPTVPCRESPDGKYAVGDYEGYIQVQIAVFRDERTLSLAMDSPDWPGVGNSDAIGQTETFRRRVGARRKKGANHFSVTFRHERPEAAQAGLRALISAHLQINSELKILDDDKQLEYVRMQIQGWSVKIERIQSEILELTGGYGGAEALNLRYSGYLERFLRTDEAIQDADRKLAALESGASSVSRGRARHVDKTPDKIAIENEEMANLLFTVRIAEAKVAALRSTGVGEGHKDMTAAVGEVRACKNARDEFALAYNRIKREELAAVSDQQRVRAEKYALVESRERIESEIAMLGRIRTAVERKMAERDYAVTQIDLIRSHLSRLNYASIGKGRIKVISEGNLPTLPAVDRRRIYGAGGGLAGLILVLLFGLLSRKRRRW